MRIVLKPYVFLLLYAKSTLNMRCSCATVTHVTAVKTTRVTGRFDCERGDENVTKCVRRAGRTLKFCYKQ